MSNYSTIRRDLCADLGQLVIALRNAQSEASLKVIIHAIRARTTTALDELQSLVVTRCDKDGSVIQRGCLCDCGKWNCRLAATERERL